VKNGIYGEMWVAAMLAAAAVTDDIEMVIMAGLAEIPGNSRLADGVLRVLSWKKGSVGWDTAIDRIHQEFNEENPHHWCHTIPNAMIVAAGLLYGEADFEKSIGIAVTAAFDTDCNGATVGSIMGMIQGANDLPGKWTDPLNNLIKSGVDGYGLVKISELAERTVSLILSNPYVSEYR
jgi:ADP-ribosylglycohydrolase